MAHQRGLLRRQLYSLYCLKGTGQECSPNLGPGGQPTVAGSLCAPEFRCFSLGPLTEQSLCPGSPPIFLPNLSVHLRCKLTPGRLPRGCAAPALPAVGGVAPDVPAPSPASELHQRLFLRGSWPTGPSSRYQDCLNYAIGPCLWLCPATLPGSSDRSWLSQSLPPLADHWLRPPGRNPSLSLPPSHQLASVAESRLTSQQSEPLHPHRVVEVFLSGPGSQITQPSPREIARRWAGRSAEEELTSQLAL